MKEMEKSRLLFEQEGYEDSFQKKIKDNKYYFEDFKSRIENRKDYEQYLLNQFAKDIGKYKALLPAYVNVSTMAEYTKVIALYCVDQRNLTLVEEVKVLIMEIIEQENILSEIDASVSTHEKIHRKKQISTLDSLYYRVKDCLFLDRFDYPIQLSKGKYSMTKEFSEELLNAIEVKIKKYEASQKVVAAKELQEIYNDFRNISTELWKIGPITSLPIIENYLEKLNDWKYLISHDISHFLDRYDIDCSTYSCFNNQKSEREKMMSRYDDEKEILRKLLNDDSIKQFNILAFLTNITFFELKENQQKIMDTISDEETTGLHKYNIFLTEMEYVFDKDTGLQTLKNIYMSFMLNTIVKTAENGNATLAKEFQEKIEDIIDKERRIQLRKDRSDFNLTKETEELSELYDIAAHFHIEGDDRNIYTLTKIISNYGKFVPQNFDLQEWKSSVSELYKQNKLLFTYFPIDNIDKFNGYIKTSQKHYVAYNEILNILTLENVTCNVVSCDSTIHEPQNPLFPPFFLD